MIHNRYQSSSDTSFHWVPFTYTGTIHAYVLNQNSEGSAESSGQASASEDDGQTTVMHMTTVCLFPTII